MQPQHSHDCAYCACNNPVLNVLKDFLFSPETLAKLTAPVKMLTVPDPKPLMITVDIQNNEVVGGTVRTMIGGDSSSTVQAIGIAGGNIVTSGDTSIVAAYMEANHAGFDTYKLTKEQTLIPGLIEPHVHIMPTAMMAGWLDLSPFEGQDLRDGYDMTYITTQIQQNKPLLKDVFIMGRGLDPALMPFVSVPGMEGLQLQIIDNTVLDKIEAEHPMFILSASMHTMYLNTAAYTYVYNSSKCIQSNYTSVSDYIKQTKGQLQETEEMQPAMTTPLVEARIVELAIPVYKEFLPQMFQQANSRGVTMMYDAGMTTNYEGMLAAYMDVTEQRLRVGAAKLCLTVEDVAELGQYKAPVNYVNGFYSHAKLVSDGSNQGLTGYQSTDYACFALNPMGKFNFPDPGQPPVYDPTGKDTNYEGMVQGAIQQGWPLMIHANGDSAVNYAVKAYQAIINDKGALRHRIEHCSLLTTDLIQTMADLGVSPSFLIGHVGYWGYAFSQVIFNEMLNGIEKYNMLDLCNTSLNNGLKITLHSDYSVSPLGPLRMMEQAISRVMEYPAANKAVLNAAECITSAQALTAATYDAAWQCYAEQWVGSLSNGLFADLTILEYDPLNCPTNVAMRDIKVVSTWVGGVQVYKDPKPDPATVN